MKQFVIDESTTPLGRIKCTIGSNLKKIRQMAGISQHQLAKLMKISQSAISQFELGKRLPSIPTMLKIADCCGFDVHIEFVSKTPSRKGRKP